MAYVYHAPTLTVDCAIFRIFDGVLQVLLIQRANEPFQGAWALPGGYNAAGDTTREALSRVLTTKVGIDLPDLTLLEQLYAFDTVARDPRGPAISIAYMGLSSGLTLPTLPGAQHPTFFALDDLPALAYDHADIIAYAHDRLCGKISYSTTVQALLPAHFTLTQLQNAYEAILGHPLDKRNFRKKFLSLEVLTPTGQYFQDGAHRPALLYRFTEREIQSLQRDF